MNTSVLDSWRAPVGAGYDPTAGRTAERVLPLLAGEHVAWLSTVRPDGTPHLVPTWFWWDGEAIVVFSKPGAVKVRNLRANPRLMVALGDPRDDFAVGLIEAEARVDDARAQVPDAFFAKYADELGPSRMDPDTFRELYTQAIRIVPSRFLAWHGRGEAHDVRPVVATTRPVSRLHSLVASAVGRLDAWLHGAAGRPLPLGAAAGA